MELFDIVVRGGDCYLRGGLARVDIGIRDGRIAAIGDLHGADADEIVEARGLHVLPGVIDSQVHFREPGLEHKEDLATGTAGAVLGGVTSIFEMPNTKPSTSTPAALADKLERARGRAHCNYAFFMGATAENVSDLGEWELLPGCAGVKVFLGSSTGSLLVEDDEVLERVLALGRRRVAVHCEDEARLRERAHLAREAGRPHAHPVWRDEETALRATERLLRRARKWSRPVHVLHVTTAEEMELLKEFRDVATVEVTPQHLTLAAPDCYDRLGTFAQMNPPIREAHHRDALWRAVRQGLVDVVGSDHAPHTREEKARPYPESPSGMPGVQTLLPLLLDHMAQGRLSLGQVVELTSQGPARVYQVAAKGALALGYDADLTLVDLNRERVVEDRDQATRSGWTPFAGQRLRGWPVMTVVGGQLAMRDGELLGEPCGHAVRFLDTLRHAD